MADIKQRFNLLKLSRGERTYFDTESKTPGLPFFDIKSRGLYVIDSVINEEGKESPGEFVRLGGISSLILKGTLDPTIEAVNNSTQTINSIENWIATTGTEIEVGDAYLVSNDFIDGKIIKGDVLIYFGPNDAENTYDKLSQNGSLIHVNGNGYWFRINGGLVEARGVSLYTKEIPTLHPISSGDPTWETTVQKASEHFGNYKLEYIGEIEELARASGENAGATLEDAVTNVKVYRVDEQGDRVFKIRTLLPGQYLYYVGPTTEYNDTFHVDKFSFIFNEGGTIHVASMGPHNSEDVLFQWKEPERRADLIYGWEGRDGNEYKDADVKTTQNALDDLMYTKADLLSNGKVPLSQIPKTLIGALQYKGTVTIEEMNALAETLPDGKLTSEAVAKYFSEKFQTGNIDDDGNVIWDPIDGGDYVILTLESPDTEKRTFELDGVIYNTNDWMIYNGETFDKLNASASVDSLNGLIASIVLKGITRPFNGGNISETEVTTDPLSNSITVHSQNAVLADDPIPNKIIPRISTDSITGRSKVVEDSGVYINDGFTGIPENSKEAVKKNISFSLNDGTVVEFPFISGTTAVTRTNTVKVETTVNKVELATSVTLPPEATRVVIKNLVNENSFVTPGMDVISVQPQKPNAAQDGGWIYVGDAIVLKSGHEGTIDFGPTFPLTESEQGYVILPVENIPSASYLFAVTKIDPIKLTTPVITGPDTFKTESEVPNLIQNLAPVNTFDGTENKLTKFGPLGHIEPSVIVEDQDKKVVSINNILRYSYSERAFAEYVQNELFNRMFYNTLPRVGQGTSSNPNVLLNNESTIDGGLWLSRTVEPDKPVPPEDPGFSIDGTIVGIPGKEGTSQTLNVKNSEASLDYVARLVASSFGIGLSTDTHFLQNVSATSVDGTVTFEKDELKNQLAKSYTAIALNYTEKTVEVDYEVSNKVTGQDYGIGVTLAKNSETVKAVSTRILTNLKLNPSDYSVELFTTVPDVMPLTGNELVDQYKDLLIKLSDKGFTIDVGTKTPTDPFTAERRITMTLNSSTVKDAAKSYLGREVPAVTTYWSVSADGLTVTQIQATDSAKTLAESGNRLSLDLPETEFDIDTAELWTDGITADSENPRLGNNFSLHVTDMSMTAAAAYEESRRQYEENNPSEIPPGYVEPETTLELYKVKVSDVDRISYEKMTLLSGDELAVDIYNEACVIIGYKKFVTAVVRFTPGFSPEGQKLPGSETEIAVPKDWTLLNAYNYALANSAHGTPNSFRLLGAKHEHKADVYGTVTVRKALEDLNVFYIAPDFGEASTATFANPSTGTTEELIVRPYDTVGSVWNKTEMSKTIGEVKFFDRTPDGAKLKELAPTDTISSVSQGLSIEVNENFIEPEVQHPSEVGPDQVV